MFNCFFFNVIFNNFVINYTFISVQYFCINTDRDWKVIKYYKKKTNLQFAVSISVYTKILYTSEYIFYHMFNYNIHS